MFIVGFSLEIIASDCSFGLEPIGVCTFTCPPLTLNPHEIDPSGPNELLPLSTEQNGS